MLKNDYLLAKIGLGTAENEPVKVQITDFSDHMFRSQTERIVGTKNGLFKYYKNGKRQ